MVSATAEDLRDAAGRNLHEKIANVLGLGIIGGETPPGALLPTEVELCGRLSVSRSALREAFQLLSAKRLIQSRQKVGTAVRPRADWNMLDPEVLAWHLQAAPTDAFVSGLFEVRKIVEPSAAALAAGLTPVVCVGEILAEREAGTTDAVVLRQLGAVVAGVGARIAQTVVAYEPVWAIGTGRTASPEQAQAVHAVLRKFLAGVVGTANEMRLLYGGSVKGDNAKALFACPDIDGGLIGGASLKAAEFLSIAGA